MVRSKNKLLREVLEAFDCIGITNGQYFKGLISEEECSEDINFWNGYIEGIMFVLGVKTKRELLALLDDANITHSC